MTHNHITAVPTIFIDLFFIFFPVHGPFPRVSPKALFHVRWWWVSQILRGFRMSCSVLKPAAFLLPPSTQDRRGGSLGITEVPWQCSPPRMSSFPVLEDLGFKELSFSNDSISLWAAGLYDHRFSSSGMVIQQRAQQTQKEPTHMKRQRGQRSRELRLDSIGFQKEELGHGTKSKKKWANRSFSQPRF